MTNATRLTILVAIIVVGLAVTYLPLQTAAEVMVGVMVVAGAVLGYIVQGRG